MNKRTTIEKLPDGHLVEESIEDIFEDEESTQEIEDAVGEGIEPDSEKCDHGVYIAPGDNNARYCTGCNPGVGIIAPRWNGLSDGVQCTRSEPELDSAEYMNLPVWARLDDANHMEENA
jgi:hypothetical protein